MFSDFAACSAWIIHENRLKSRPRIDVLMKCVLMDSKCLIPQLLCLPNITRASSRVTLLALTLLSA